MFKRPCKVPTSKAKLTSAMQEVDLGLMGCWHGGGSVIKGFDTFADVF